jgi:Pectinacetylesterase
MQAPPSRHRPYCTKHSVTATLAAFTLAGLFTACSNDGDSDDNAASTTTTSTSATTTTPAPELSAEEEAALETEVEFANCMRDNGIEGLPEPQVTQDHFVLVGFPLVLPENWDSAQQACQHIIDEAAPPEESGGDAPAGWERVKPGGDCECSDGSEFNFWVREASPEKVVLFLQGGGNCFSAETCAPERGIFDRTVDAEDHPSGAGGIFDFADERNPFADYSVVFVPYCTGDVHVGNAVTQYEPGLTVHHKGFVNGTAALDHLVAAFPGATDVVVAGESAGSVPSPLYAGLVSDRLPDARITVLADGSGASPDSPDLNRRLADAWGADTTIPSWPENAGVTAEPWSAHQLFISSGRHDPDIVFARHDYAYDEQQAVGLAVIFESGVQDLLSLIDGHETQIEDAGVNLLSYIAPGDEHTVLTDERFYSESVNGESLVEWVTALIAGEPAEDVHCDQCHTP